MIREWIIFALCLGAGGHIALAVMLHAPNLWPWSTAGFYGLLTGIVLYALVQGGRVLWKLSRHSSHAGPRDKPGTFW
jgi:predicted anti-sigma-YlaC factor YlaD